MLVQNASYVVVEGVSDERNVQSERYLEVLLFLFFLSFFFCLLYRFVCLWSEQVCPERRVSFALQFRDETTQHTVDKHIFTHIQKS